jgi:hypothetical protein
VKKLKMRVPPLIELARQALIDAYCPVPSRVAVTAQDTNRDCLARIYQLAMAQGSRHLLEPVERVWVAVVFVL